MVINVSIKLVYNYNMQYLQVGTAVLSLVPRQRVTMHLGTLN